ncbi:cobalamin biosynthesis protein CobD [Gordonia spumicola]|uniref:Cobalamin biosynthesis protein CobD n=1 Tax=Gordonia spumicola TaxID=589161 RepID=A0A7I9VDP4_9ACTN|nr:cobalamin biosynthesis protein [Gordonia spumicola]GEE03427.1 cobalamin biosynthesis protein CobD [Gordonia spumicola]
MQLTADALGISAGAVADAVFSDPRRGHPVALFGTTVAAIEKTTYADSRLRGALFAAAGIGIGVCAGIVARKAGAAGTAAATFTALGGTSLAAIGDDIADALDAGDIAGARALVAGLVGRDTTLLDEAGICRAAVESIAENTSDATVAPLFWGAVAGAPGLLGYRAANTLDAMVGYRSPRYQRFGWASARIDDVANIVPARLTAVLVGVLSGAPGPVWRAVRRDAAAHPSPNAGVVEAAFAGALGITLGGRTVYAHGTELRPTLGDGRPPLAADLRAATRLSRRVQRASAVAASLAVARGQFRSDGVV